MRQYNLNPREGYSKPEQPKGKPSEKQGGFQLREGQGTLFNNKHKEPGDKRPALTGKLLIEGREYEIAVWKKEARSGSIYYSMQASLPDQTDAERPQEHPDYDGETRAETREEPDRVASEDIPF